MKIRKSLLRYVGCLSLLALSANATTTHLLDTPNSALSGSSPGPFGTVIVNLSDPTHASIEFVANPGFVFLDGEAVDFNLNGSSVAITVSTISPGTVSLSAEGLGNADGFGKFNRRFTSGNAGPQGRFTEALFNLVNNSGSWSSSDDVLIDNALGNQVAAHIGVGGLSGDLPPTGFASASDLPVPEGSSTAILLGLATLVFGSIPRRLFRK